jgi:hypothetical protein
MLKDLGGLRVSHGNRRGFFGLKNTQNDSFLLMIFAQKQLTIILLAKLFADSVSTVFTQQNIFGSGLFLL